MIVAHVAVLPDQTLGQLLGHARARGPQVMRVLQDVASRWKWRRSMILCILLTCHPCDGCWAASSAAGPPPPCILSSASGHSSHPGGCSWPPWGQICENIVCNNMKTLNIPDLPSELSSKQGGSHPAYFCSRACLSPWSSPNNDYKGPVPDVSPRIFPHLIWQWCQTCSSRPGTGAALRWSSPSSELPSSVFKVWFGQFNPRIRPTSQQLHPSHSQLTNTCPHSRPPIRWPRISLSLVLLRPRGLTCVWLE